MMCLRCGSCCKELSPFGNPCSYLEMQGNVAVCSIYEKRPGQCSNHNYPASKCPIGMQELNIQDSNDLMKRYGETGELM